MRIENGDFFVSLQPQIKNMKQTMILAAGLGTRLKPLTDTMPKALVPIGGTPLLDINIRRLQSQGYDRFVVNIHHFAQQIIDHVRQQDYAPLVHFSDETAQLLETGGGLKKAQGLFRDDQPILSISSIMLTTTGSPASIRLTRMPCCWSASARRSATSCSTMLCI